MTTCVPTLAASRAIAPAVLPVAPAAPLVSMSVSELIHSAMRMLGVLAPCDTLAEQEMAACLVVLRMIHPQLQPDRDLALSGHRLSWLRYELAAEMAPEFDIWDFRQKCGPRVPYIVDEANAASIAELWERANAEVLPILRYRELA